jgi:hypothetical protein
VDVAAVVDVEVWVDVDWVDVDWVDFAEAAADADAAVAASAVDPVTEFTTDPTVPVTGSLTAWTTPETVDVTPESSDGCGWLLVAA